MRIAVVSTSRIPSLTANSIQVMKVAQALTQLGHQVELLVPDYGEHPDWEALAAHYGLQTPFLVRWLPSMPRWKRYDFALAAMRRIGQFKAELVYTWMLQVAVMSLVRGTAAMIEMHDRPAGRFGPTLFRAFWRLPGKKRLLPITQALRRVLEQDYHLAFPEALVAVSPDGVDLERYAGLPEAAEARRQLALPDCPTAGFTGHFYAGRGMDLLLSLAQNLPHLHFLWVGGRPEDVDHWRARLEQDGVRNVTLTGFVANQKLPLYQAAADVLLMPYGRAVSGSSGGNIADIYSPMKMFEYMATGRTILTSDLPVLHEVLNDSNAAFCEPGSPEAWRAALDALMADPSRREALARQAKEDARRYTWKARAARALEGFTA